MPFKGMLKWAVAKEDHPSSKTKSTTKSLKKRRKQSHHYHYCSILKSGVCLRIENASTNIASSSTSKKAILSSLPPPPSTIQSKHTTAVATSKDKVFDNRNSCVKLNSNNKCSSTGESGSSGANNTNKVNNYSRGSNHSVQRSTSSSRFRIKTVQHCNNNNINKMGNNLQTVKSADKDDQGFSSFSSLSQNGPHCVACPSGETISAANNRSSHGSNARISFNNTNNNTSNQNNNKLNHECKNDGISRTTDNIPSSKLCVDVVNRKGSRSVQNSPVKNGLRSSSGAEHERTGNAVGGNADSKSLLYMSLDHLPLAIVKQYERMLQESATTIATTEDGGQDKSEEFLRDTLKKPVAVTNTVKEKQKKPLPPSNSAGALDDPSIIKKNAYNRENATSMPTIIANSPVSKPRSSIIKQNQGLVNGTTKKSGNSSNQRKKITIISPPKSKPVKENAALLPASPIINNAINREQRNNSSTKENSSKNHKQSKSKEPNVNIKEAHNRPLQLHSDKTCVVSPSKKKSPRLKQTSHRQEQTTTITSSNDRCTQTRESNSKSKGRFKVTIVSSPVSNGVEVIADINEERTKKNVKTRDASCETESKLFPLKSILKDCKSSTLPRMKNQQHSKPKKTISSSSSSSSSSSNNETSRKRSEKNAIVLSGRSSSFKSLSASSRDLERETFLCSPLSSRKLFQEGLKNNIYNACNEESFKSPLTPPSAYSTIPKVNFTTIRNNTTTINDHDVTDPQFLEEPMPISTPAVSRCAKKLTLKRSEIRKLEKIRNQTEKLNRFLKKYYHDCLPNLPEEEEEQCSPEEKSVHFSVLRTHWIEKKPEEFSTGKNLGESQPLPKHPRQRRNTLPHPNVSTAAAIEEAARVLAAAGERFNEHSDCISPLSSPISNGRCSQENTIKQRNNKNSSLLSSSAYYSDPILSSLPIIIENSEFPLHHQMNEKESEKEKVQMGLSKKKCNKTAKDDNGRSASCSSILINNNNNRTESSFASTSIPDLNNAFLSNESRRSSSGSITSSTCYSCSGSCCSASKCSSTTSSIVNLANEFRMAEVIRHDNNIHESFLMSTHNFPLEDNSLILFTEKEFRGATTRCIPTLNGHEGDEFEQTLEYANEKPNQNCESPSELKEEKKVENEEGGNNIDSFAIASPTFETGVEGDQAVLKKSSDSNNNNNNNEEGSKNKRLNTCNNNGNKSTDFMIPFASTKNKNTSVGSSSSNDSINSVDEEPHGIIEEEAADHCFGPEKLKGYTTMMMMMMGSSGGEVKPLGNNNPFDVPTSVAEDEGFEGFMSPYPPEAYSPASSSSNTSIPHNSRLSISSGKGSAEDYDDERRLELFFLDSSCETSTMAEQQIAAYKQHHYHEFKPELIHIPGEKSYHLNSSKQGHDSHVENLKKDDADDTSIKLISSNHYPYYQTDQHHEESKACYENVDESVDRKESEEHCQQQHLEKSLCIPFQISEPTTPAQPPGNSALLENSNYFSACDEKGTWDSHDYATIVGCSSNCSTTSGSSSSTSTYAACGSFFPNPSLLENHHERQVSSDSSSTAAYSLLNECENDHHHQHLHQCHHHQQEEDDHHHHYDQVAPSIQSSKDFGDNDFHTANRNNDNINENYDNATQQDNDEEESIIIQSSVGNPTGGFVGIAFSTPIPPKRKLQQNRQLIRRLKNNANNYSLSRSNALTPGHSKSSFCSSTAPSLNNGSIISVKKNSRYFTPKKVVRKPPVRTPFSDKGEVLLRCYRNGDYVTVHVVQVKNLQACYGSSWKLSMKISLIPEGEATFTKSESVVVPRARRFVRIDQKFSFEIPLRTKSHYLNDIQDNSTSAENIPDVQTKRKVFLTFVKRIEKKTTFLGWITLDVPEKEYTTQCWQKLRKRKMSSASYSAHNSNSSHLYQSSSQIPSARPGPSRQPAIAPPTLGGATSTCSEAMVGLPSHIETLEQGVIVPSVPSRNCKSPECYQPEYIGKTQLQNSSTMDSGVEDCCEPPSVPSIELDEKMGFRVRVHMTKPEGAGFGFSVVWVAPPRIERLEKDKTAELAGLKIGDLIIGVNGEDVTNVANTTIYNKMKSTGTDLDLEVWRKHPHVASPIPPHMISADVPQSINPAACIAPPMPASSIGTTMLPPKPVAATMEGRDHQSSSTAMPLRSNAKISSGLPSSSTSVGSTVSGSNNALLNRLQSQLHPPTSILKPPPPAPPGSSQKVGNACPSQSHQSTTAASSWRIRFNIELLDNEDDNLKQFFICELKFFRKVVAALDRYLIPAQANRLLTPQEIHSIFAQVIKIITMTKRILQCVANGSNNSSWKLGRILLSTHTDHLPDITSAYTAYARSLGSSATLLSEKMGIQDFAKFVLETPVPKGHLDMTSLLFAPFEHLRNLCEIGEEISHQHDNWMLLNSRLKECYADIVCETDFMEPISHISMKKNPLVSVRDLEKRIISTISQQPLKVCEKGRKWLFGSRLYRRENDGSWSPVWAFLFTDIIVLTSHMTRDRVFFVKESPIRLDDVVTLHFNLPKKHENEFRLLFGPDSSHHSRLDRILPLVRSKKPNQIVLRTANAQLKCLWKLLLQRQIISLNTKLSKSASSNFSISEFCEKFPVVQHDSIMEEDEEKGDTEPTLNVKKLHVQQQSASPVPMQMTQNSNEPHSVKSPSPNTRIVRPQTGQTQQGQTQRAKEAMKPQMTVKIGDSAPISKPVSKSVPISTGKEEVRVNQTSKEPSTSTTTSVTSPTAKPYVPDGFSSLNKDLLRSRVTRPGGERRPSIPSNATNKTVTTSNVLDIGDKVQTTTTITDPSHTLSRENGHSSQQPSKTQGNDDVKEVKPTQHDMATSTDNLISSAAPCIIPPVPKARTSLQNSANLNVHLNAAQNVYSTTSHNNFTKAPTENSSSSPIPSHNNNNTIDNSVSEKESNSVKCPCEKIQESSGQMENSATPTIIRRDMSGIHHQPTAHPSPKPRQLSSLRKQHSTDEGTPIHSRQVNNNIQSAFPDDANTNTKCIANKVSIAKEKELSQPETLQSPIMVKRALALASGSASPSSVSSLSPARRLYQGKSIDADTTTGSLKSKPGSKIMTNAILKSRQHELMAQNLQTASVSTETLRTEKSSDTTASTSKTDSSTQYFSLKEESTTTSSCSNQSQSDSLPEKCIHTKSILVHHQHHSHHCPAGCSGTSTIVTTTTEALLGSRSPYLSAPPRCHSENSHHPKKSRPVHTDSPIISGYGSERTRRRMLIDNKLKKDYPELFGITPKDRRTFIKQLGEEDVKSGGLVAPYYYTLSPVPIPKHTMMAMASSSTATDPTCTRSNPRKQANEFGNCKSNQFVIPPYNPNSERNGNEHKLVRNSFPPSKGVTSTTTGLEKHEILKNSSKPICTNNKIEQCKSTKLESCIGESQTTNSAQQSRESNNACRNFPDRRLQNDCKSSNQATQAFSRTAQEERERCIEDDNDDDEMVAAGGFSSHDVFQASLELDEDGERLKAFVEKMREDMTVGSDEEEEDNDDDDDDEDDDGTEGTESDSDDSTAGGHEEVPGQSHRSHEESSNDSGISDEMTEKSKTTLSGLLEEDERSLSLSISRGNENFSNMLDRMRTGVLAAEVKNPDKISSNTNTSAVSNSTTPVANSNTAHILIHDLSVKTPVVDDVGNNVLVVDNNNCCSLNYTVDHANKTQCVDESTLCFLEGETKATVATMVVLKVDKATETEDDDFNFLHAFNNTHDCSHSHANHQPQKPLRSVLAERREAFFLSNQSTFPTSHHHHYPSYLNKSMTADEYSTQIHDKSSHHHPQQCGPYSSHLGGCMTGANSGANAGCLNCTDVSHPLRVKILDGNTVHSVVDSSTGMHKNEAEPNPQLCERVQLQRLERQKRAKVERVESSEDSTSSSSDLASASPAAENGTTDPSWSSSSSSLAGYGSSKEDSVANNNNNNASSSTLATAVPVTSNISSSSSSNLCVSVSTSVSANNVASSVCSNCSNTNNNNHIVNDYCKNTNFNNKESISIGTSCSTSTSAQTCDDEPSSSCNEHTPNSSLENGSSKTTNCVTNTMQSTSTNTPCSHRQCKTFPNKNVTTSNTCEYYHSELKQHFENSSEVDSSSSSSTSSTSNSKQKMTTYINHASTSSGPSSSRAGGVTESSVNNVFNNCGDCSNGNNNYTGDEQEADFASARSLMGPEIVVTQESDQEEDSSHSSNENGNTRHGYSSDGEEDSIVCNGKAVDSVGSDGGGSSASAGDGGGSGSSNRSSKSFLRVESNDSTAENYGDDDDYNFDDEEDEDDLSHCSVATINRYGTFESLEKLESEDTVGGLPDFPRSMPRSKARFTFEDDDDDDDLFEEDFETDFNFRFPSQIQDNTYSVSRLGPLPPLLEEDYEDEMYDEQRASGSSPSGSSGIGEYSGGAGIASGCSSSASLRARHEVPSVAVQRVTFADRSITNTPRVYIPNHLPSTSLSLHLSRLENSHTSNSSPVVPRAQKLVVVTSSESEMIVFGEADSNGSSSKPDQLHRKKDLLSSSSSSTDSKLSTMETDKALSFKNPLTNVSTNTSI